MTSEGSARLPSEGEIGTTNHELGMRGRIGSDPQRARLAGGAIGGALCGGICMQSRFRRLFAGAANAATHVASGNYSTAFRKDSSDKTRPLRH